MSITRTDYVMFGLWMNKLQIKELDKTNPDWLESTEIGKYCHKDGFQGFNIVYDGMNKDYLCFGYVIDMDEEKDGLSFHTFNTDSLGKWYEDSASLINTFNRLFGSKMEEQDLDLMIFTHWS